MIKIDLLIHAKMFTSISLPIEDGKIPAVLIHISGGLNAVHF